MRPKIIGVGSYLPQEVRTNKHLEQYTNTSDEWIQSRTGIKQRHIAKDDEYTSHMAYQAALNAIQDSDIDKDTIDLIIVCTNTPDHTFPGVANKIQGYLNLHKNVPSFDIQAICSGFIYGIEVANNMLLSKKYKTVLLVCADKMSSLLDWSDRKTSILFGDGAGAVILQQSYTSSGIIDINIYSDGHLYDILHTNGGVSTNQKAGTIHMNGQEVFKCAVEKMSESIDLLLKSYDLKISDINYFIPHQANLRIMNNLATRFGFRDEQLVTTVQTHANCSAASIPLALSSLKATSDLKKGDLLLFTSFGAGLSWGAMIVRW